METKIVYVVYGSRTEISNLIAFLVSGEWAFNYSGEYLYFSNDPTELIKEAGMDLKAVTEHWCTNWRDQRRSLKPIRSSKPTTSQRHQNTWSFSKPTVPPRSEIQKPDKREAESTSTTAK